MASWLTKYHLGHYEKVQEGDEADSLEQQGRRPQVTRICGASHFIYLILIISVAIGSYQLSWLHFQSTDYYGVEPMRSSLRLKTSPYIFQPNMTFVMPPSKEVDEAWKSLVPLRRGFFIHPTVAPKRSSVSVFHQIHCLGLLREAVYTSRPDLAWHGKEGPKRRSDDHDELNHLQSPWHIGHCFDLVRQALMCRPDLTIELADEKTKGANSYGIEHQCINWGELLDWMKKYE